MRSEPSMIISNEFVLLMKKIVCMHTGYVHACTWDVGGVYTSGHVQVEARGQP